MQIHLRRDGKTVGPYSLPEIQRQVAAGELPPDTLAWHDGLPDWRPVDEVVARLTGKGPDLPPTPMPPIYVGFWWRVLAWLLDALIVGAMGELLFWGFSRGAGDPQGWSSSCTAVVLGWLYAALMESSSRQATVGKIACGFRVTDEAGRRISFARATGRHFGKILDMLTLGIGFLMVAWTRRKQGLHDLLARTLVVRLR